MNLKKYYFKKFKMNGDEILEYARTRDDLGIYDDDLLLNYCFQYYRIGDIEDCLDEFSEIEE